MVKVDKMKDEHLETDLSKFEQNESIDEKTGLTNLQENVAHLIVSGTSITEISHSLDISRNTIYNWQEQDLFQAYCNRLNSEIKKELRHSLFSLYKDAVEVIQKTLQSDNEKLRFKSACYLVDKISNTEIHGNTTIREVIFTELDKNKDSWRLHPIGQSEIEEELKKRGLQ